MAWVEWCLGIFSSVIDDSGEILYGSTVFPRK